MGKIKTYCLVLFLFLFLFSCHKNGNSTYTFTKDSYPLAVGNWWKYQRANFFSGGNTDTVVMTIASVSIYGMTKNYTCNITRGGVIIDSGHFVLSDTALYYSGSNPYYSVFGTFNLKFPFGNGQEWPGIRGGGDTLKVDGVNKGYKILGVLYSPMYSLTRRIMNPPAYFLVQNLDLTPGVGIDDEGIDLQSDSLTIDWNQVSMQLMSYHVQ